MPIGDTFLPTVQRLCPGVLMIRQLVQTLEPRGTTERDCHGVNPMPYATVDDLPPARRRLPWHARGIFRSAFNAAWQSCADHRAETQEEIAHRIAWAAVKRRYRKIGECWIEK
jgi:cation transport regulator